MADDGVQVAEGGIGEGSAGKWILLALAVLYVAGSLYFIFDLRGRLDKMSKDQAASSAQIADLGKRMQSAEADDETLAQQVGLTKKEMASRSAEIMRQQRASEARLAEQQKQQISAVSGEVAGVKTDVGGVKTDVASTRADLEATKAKLQSTIGDLGVQSGLVANTREDLEILKHKGDRNYLRIYADQRRKDAARFNRRTATEENGRKEGEIHSQRHVRRPDHRKERSQRKRTDPVLQWTRPDALRIGGLDGG